MCFESANRLLVQLFTGTVGQTEVICRRYLENQALLEVDIEDDSISQIVTAWSGQSAEVNGNRTFKRDVLETDFVQAARIVYKNADIYSRVQFGSLYFDSACYRRNSKAHSGIFFSKRMEIGFVAKFCTFLVYLTARKSMLSSGCSKHSNISKVRKSGRVCISLLLKRAKQLSYLCRKQSNFFAFKPVRKRGSAKSQLLLTINELLRLII